LDIVQRILRTLAVLADQAIEPLDAS